MLGSSDSEPSVGIVPVVRPDRSDDRPPVGKLGIGVALERSDDRSPVGAAPVVRPEGSDDRASVAGFEI